MGMFLILFVFLYLEEVEIKTKKQQSGNTRCFFIVKVLEDDLHKMKDQSARMIERLEESLIDPVTLKLAQVWHINLVDLRFGLSLLDLKVLLNLGLKQCTIIF